MCIRYFLLLVLMLATPGAGICGDNAYDGALLQALAGGDWEFARLLVEKGANINYVSPNQATSLIGTLSCCGFTADRNSALSFLRFLLAKGAKVNVASVYGATPLMFADRVDSPEAVDLLKKAGALPFDPSDPRIKAILIRIDAVLIARQVDNYHIQYDGRLSEKQIDFARLAEYMGDTLPKPPKEFFSTCRVLNNQGLDLLGNAYILRPWDVNEAQINPKTIEALSDVVSREYWKGFLPD